MYNVLVSDAMVRERLINCVVHGREFPQDVELEVDLLGSLQFNELLMPWTTPVKLANK